MKYLLSIVIILALVTGIRAQDSLGLSMQSEIYPVFNTQRKVLGEGIGVDLQKTLDNRSKVGLGYSKMTFDKHTSRSMEVMYYNESDSKKLIQLNLGVGFFIRQWTDMILDDQTPEYHERKSLTTGYALSLGAKAHITKNFAFATRFCFNNNIDSDITYSFRPGFIVSI